MVGYVCGLLRLLRFYQHCVPAGLAEAGSALAAGEGRPRRRGLAARVLPSFCPKWARTVTGCKPAAAEREGDVKGYVRAYFNARATKAKSPAYAKTGDSFFGRRNIFATPLLPILLLLLPVSLLPRPPV